MVDNTTPFEREGEGFQSTTFYWDLISGYRVICRWNIAHPVLSTKEGVHHQELFAVEASRIVYFVTKEGVYHQELFAVEALRIVYFMNKEGVHHQELYAVGTSRIVYFATKKECITK